ncbi:alpha/beta hydrolase family protein [Brevundimonas sp.]
MTLLLSGLAAVAVAVAPVQAQTPAAELTGTWEGPLTVGGQSIRIVFRIEAGGVAVMDSPDQGGFDIPAEAPTIENGLVRLTVPSIGGRFEGARSGDGRTLTGSLHQGGVTLPLILTRTSETAARLVRPQTPVPPFTYRSEEVAFDNAEASGVRLAGTLTLPQGSGPFPAAILITGSGPQDRDETVFGHRPFAVWADALTRRGVAVLRYDDRGTAASTGDFASATSADFATDADAAFAFLAARSDIDAARIGLIGHSEGGAIAPLVAQEGVPVAWIVMIAGPAVSGGEILSEQQRLLATAMGAGPEAVAAGNVTQRAIMALVAAHADDGEAVQREVTTYLVGQGMPQAAAAQSAAQVSSPWFRWFIAHDPAPALAGFHGPMLALYGGKDLQVPAEQNAPVLERLKPDAEVVVLPELNHLMQPATTGLPNEYAGIETTLDPQAISTVVDWVAAR